MSKRILEYDPVTAITTTFEYDPISDETIIGRHQDVGVILDMNKAVANDEDISKRGIKAGWWHYATIPNIIIEKFRTEHGVDFFNKDHQKAIFRLLNQPEYRYLKTTTKMHRG